MMRRRSLRALARPAVVAVVASLVFGVSASAGLPSLTPPAGPPGALPAQPEVPPSACVTPGATAGAWSQVASVMGIPPWAASAGAKEPVPQEQITVDPWQPCEMFRADSADTVTRSNDGGRTWTAVLHDDAAGYTVGALQPAPFHARSIQVIAPHTVAVAESGNGDALLISRDDGTHWTLADNGIAGQPIMALVAAPSDPSVIYAVASPTGSAGTNTVDAPGIYVTNDGGQSWSSTGFPRIPDVGTWQVYPGVFSVAGFVGTLGRGSLLAQCGSSSTPPCDAYPQVQVDPADAAHLWAMVAVPSDGNDTTFVFASRDEGQTWALQAQLPAAYTELLATSTPDHGTRLYVANYNGNDTGNAQYSPGIGPLRSDDGGTNWSSIPASTALTYTSLAADPANPDVMHYAGALGGYSIADAYGVDVAGLISYDGFDTSTPIALGPRFTSPVQGPDPPYSPLVGGWVADGSVALQADRQGNFYLAVDEGCYTAQAGPPCLPGATPNAPHQYQLQAYYRFTAPPPPTRPGSGGPAGTSTSTGGGGGGSTPVGRPMQQLRQCALPATSVRPGEAYGNLAFDGEALLYTQYLDTGTQPYTGVVHRMDGSTCRSLSDLTVQFSRTDLAQVAQETGEPDTAVHPYIDTMTYDPNHDVLWLSLASGNTPLTGNAAQGGVFGNGPDIVGIFSASFANGPAGPRSLAVATLRFSKPHCSGSFGEGEDLFTYDFGDNTLWACDFVKGKPPPPPPVDPLGEGNDFTNGQGAHLDPSGHMLPSCIDGADSGSSPFEQISNWVVAAPGHLFIQSEDDETIFDVLTSDCSTVNTFVHRNFGEPTREDEQMACDSLTFGQEAVAAGGAPVTRPTSVIWLRDALNQLVVAYAVPDAACPYPTQTHFLGPVRATRGQIAELCATLYRAGIPHPLPEEVLDFHLNGRDVGMGYTNNAGLACVKTFVALGGGTYPVTVRFAGTPEWYPSGDVGALTVDVPAPGPVPPIPAILPPLAPPQPPLQQPLTNPAPNPNPLPNPAPQPQAQTQTQGQQQAQANLQAGLNGQEEEQVQPQAAMAMLPDEQGQELGYAMSRVSAGTRDSLLGLGLGAAFAASFAAGLAWAWRAPAAALARRRPRRGRDAPGR